MAKKRKRPPSPFKRGDEIITDDGPGVIIGFSMRRNTNGGPGCWESVVQLKDGRIRHYSMVTLRKNVDGLSYYPYEGIEKKSTS